MNKILKFAIIGVSIIISSFILGKAYSNKYVQNDVISVTGSGETDFTSDLIVWKATFQVFNVNLSEAYKHIKEDRNHIEKYFKDKGVSTKSLVFSSVMITKDYNEKYNEKGDYIGKTFNGYILSQTITIESKEVDKIEALSREATDLIDQGIELVSEAPSYYYTQLSKLKLKMIQNATKDAYTRAKIIAENGGGKLGKLKSSSMGVIQINGRNSNEDYSWGGNYNTSSKLKTASITIRLTYLID